MSNIDLHTHVIPPTVVEVMRRDPQRFGTKVIEDDGAEPIGSDPEAFREFMLADLKKWADVMQRSGAKFE